MKSNPHPVDVYVGSRLRTRRTLLGMSQEKLGETIGLTFQQIQKYERGANRISASRIFELATVLGVSEFYFFEGLKDKFGPSRPGLAEAPQEQYEGEDQMGRRETLELVRSYYQIHDPEVRKRINDMIKAIGNAKVGPTLGSNDDAEFGADS